MLRKTGKKVKKKLGSCLKRCRFRERLLGFLEYLVFRLDTTKFIFDKPKFDYQPIPWLGMNEAAIRGETTKERWNKIQQHLNNQKSLKDVGCCVGYFCISASEKFGMNTIGVESNERFLRIARHAVPKKYLNNCNFINLEINEHNVALLPKTDVTLCLSIWHHWVYHYGLEAATKILTTLWQNTNDILFFESGEEEIMEEFNLPVAPSMSVKEWLLDYLNGLCDDGKVEIIGEFCAGDYSHYKIKNHKRSLFKVQKMDIDRVIS